MELKNSAFYLYNKTTNTKHIGQKKTHLRFQSKMIDQTEKVSIESMNLRH